MKKYLIIIGSYIFPVLVLANGGHAEEDTAISAQLQEFLPFEHIEEEHWFAFGLSVILWLSLIYTIFSFIKKFRKPEGA